MAIQVTASDLAQAFPKAEKLICDKGDLVEQKIAQAIALTDEDTYGDQAALIAQYKAMQLIAIECGQVDDKGCTIYDKWLDMNACTVMPCMVT